MFFYDNKITKIIIVKTKNLRPFLVVWPTIDFPKTEKSFPHVEFAFPMVEAAFPHVEFPFPMVEVAFPHVEFAFPIVEAAFPHVEFAFPMVVAAFPHVEFSFPMVEVAFPQLQFSLSLLLYVFERLKNEYRNILKIISVKNQPFLPLLFLMFWLVSSKLLNYSTLSNLWFLS